MRGRKRYAEGLRQGYGFGLCGEVDAGNGKCIGGEQTAGMGSVSGGETDCGNGKCIGWGNRLREWGGRVGCGPVCVWSWVGGIGRGWSAKDRQRELLQRTGKNTGEGRVKGRQG
jgi:hypothetical protein